MLGLVANVLTKPGALRMAGSALSWGTGVGTMALGGEALMNVRDEKENQLIAEGQKNGKYKTNWLDKGLQKVGLFKSDADLLEGTNEKTRNEAGQLQAYLMKHGDGADYSFKPGETADQFKNRNAIAITTAQENKATKDRRNELEFRQELEAKSPVYQLQREQMAQQDRMNMFAMQERMYDRSHQRRRDTQNAMLGMGGALAAILSA